MFFKLQNYNKPVKKPDVNEKFVYESRFNDKTNEFNMFVSDVIASNFKLSNEIAKKVTLQKFVEDRVKYYLGDMYDKQIVYPNNDYINVDVLANDMDSTRKKYPKGIFKHGIYTGTICKMTHFGLKVIDKAGLSGYTKRFLPYFSILNVPNKYFLYLIGDVEINDDDYFFTKIRLSECKKGVILKAPNLQRHWGPLYSREVFENDIPYEQKKNVALWRGATTGQPNRPANRDVTISLTINLEEAIHGKQVTVQYKTTRGMEHAELNIPPGMQHGQTIKYNGMGDNALSEFPRGSLIVIVKYAKHRYWSVDGPNLKATEKLHILHLLKGSKINLTTIDGNTIRLNIPKGTAPGTTFSINGAGLLMNRRHRGNAYIKVNVIMPDLDDNQLMQIENIIGYNH